MKPKKTDKIYFMGIGGTGMAAAAGLLQEAGYNICGSDAGVYPPMSDLLADLGIPYTTPYDEQNIQKADPDLVVVANALSRGNVEVESMLAQEIPYTSFPELLGDCFLKDRQTIVVSGTHGKTTTTSAMAHILEQTGQQPGFLIGGIPHDFKRSFRVGTGKAFAIEGDEYDTAFFDKNSKFHHYHPQFLIVNNLEFDHADIFDSIDDIYREFEKLLKNMGEPRHIIANVDNPGVATLLHRIGLTDHATQVATEGKDCGAQYQRGEIATRTDPDKGAIWSTTINGCESFGDITFETHLVGVHNLANVAMIVACLDRMNQAGALDKPMTQEGLTTSIGSFRGVKRRMESLGQVNGIDVFEDFAHHPTAVDTVIAGFRRSFPDRRLVVAFEPRSASQRRNVFSQAFAQALAKADEVLIGECPLDTRIPESERMNTAQLKSQIGHHATAFPTNPALLEALVQKALPGDAIIFMSSGSFSGVQHQVVDALKQRVNS